MFNPMRWWSTLQVALVFAIGPTSFVWAIAVYRTGLRVALVANQLALTSICLANNGTIDEALCHSYLASFNTNFAAISTAVGRGDGTAATILVPWDGAHHQSFSLAIVLVVTFFCTAAGVFALLELTGRLQRRAEMREAAQELDEIKQDEEEQEETSGTRTRTREGNGKAPGVVGVRPFRP